MIDAPELFPGTPPDPVLLALAAAIVIHPDDDVPRLEYADRLDELEPVRVTCPECKGIPYHVHGANCVNCLCRGTGEVIDETNPRRAELIKTQVALEPLRGCVCICGASGRRDPACRFGEFSDLSKREDDLVRLLKITSDANKTVRLQRGFVTLFRGTAAQFLRWEPAAIWHPFYRRPCPITAQPVRAVEITRVEARHRRAINAWAADVAPLVGITAGIVEVTGAVNDYVRTQMREASFFARMFDDGVVSRQTLQERLGLSDPPLEPPAGFIHPNGT